MITPNELKQRMEKQPFQPFRIHTTSGLVYDVTNHDMMFIKRHEVEIALDPDSEGFAVRCATVPLLHVATVEDLSASKPS
jgi:hypothetical protein